MNIIRLLVGQNLSKVDFTCMSCGKSIHHEFRKNLSFGKGFEIFPNNSKNLKVLQFSAI